MSIMFNIETPVKGVSDDWIEMVRLIETDPKLTLREKQTCVALLNLAQTVNQLVNDLNFGTATVVPEEDDVFYKRSDRQS